MASKVTYRLLKNGSSRITIRNRFGNTTVTKSTGGRRKPRTTITTRSGNYTFTRSR